MALTESDKINCFRIAYAALDAGQGAAAPPAAASLKLLLVDILGEVRAHTLIEQWNAERTAESAAQKPQLDFGQLATGGLAFEFVSAGMPPEWAKRHIRLFRYMPPMSELPSPPECVARRQAGRRARDWPRALDAGNMLIASAILSGNATVLFAYATENLAILKAWQAAEPNPNREREFEEYEWLRDHAPGMARWGGIVRSRLDALVR